MSRFFLLPRTPESLNTGRLVPLAMIMVVLTTLLSGCISSKEKAFNPESGVLLLGQEATISSRDKQYALTANGRAYVLEGDERFVSVSFHPFPYSEGYYVAQLTGDPQSPEQPFGYMLVWIEGDFIRRARFNVASLAEELGLEGYVNDNTFGGVGDYAEDYKTIEALFKRAIEALAEEDFVTATSSSYRFKN